MAGTDFPPPTNYPINELNIPWREFIGKSPGWTQDMAFGGGITRAAFIMDVSWANLENAIWQIVGYSEAPAGTGAIRRHLPMSHPYLGFLWAKNIVRVEGVKWEQLTLDNLVDTGAAGIIKTPQNVYAGARLTVEFWIPDFLIAPDAAGLPEWARYCTPLTEPSAEYITREAAGANFTYNDPAAPSNGKAFPGSRNQLLAKKRLAFLWRQVPFPGLYPNIAAGSWSSPNLDGGMGQINSGQFMGENTGTLLAEPYKPTLIPWPVNLRRLGMNPALGSPCLVDVAVSLLWFDPPVDPGGNGQHGHNLAPDKMSPSGYWYSLATAGGASQYPSYDFTKLFKMNN